MPLRIADDEPLLLSDGVPFRERWLGSQRVGLSACGVAGQTNARCSQAGEERRIPAQHCIPPQFLLQRSVERVANARRGRRLLRGDGNLAGQRACHVFQRLVGVPPRCVDVAVSQGALHVGYRYARA